MSLNWASHVCSYYCQGGVHAIPLLAKAGITTEEIRTAMELGSGEGEEVVDVRPVPEVDVDQWRKEIFTDPEVWTKDGTTGIRIDAQVALYYLATVPFLLLIRIKEEQPPCSH